MDYSNENFEHFQNRLSDAVGECDLLWLLRDSLFAVSYYGMRNNQQPLLAAPGGDIIALAKAIILRPHGKAPENLSKVNTCVLLPSSRSNHVGRLIPYIHDLKKNCSVLATEPAALKLVNVNDVKWSVMIGGAWKRTIRPRHYLEAREHAARLAQVMPEKFTHKQLSAVRIFLSEFFTWKYIWRLCLESCQPQTIISTFEKSPSAKAFFYAGWEIGIPNRIHWVHGLRHASLQATLSTELWCMTPGDVRYFKSRIPTGCKAYVKDNPECLQLAKEIGVIEPKKDIHGAVRFLFLGPGANASYTKPMRLADLRVIRFLQTTYGNQFEWRFRPHPSKVERFSDELKEAGITVNDFSTRPLYDDLRWSHAVGSATSSLMLDWRKTGRKIFWIQSEIRKLCAVDELIEDGIGVHLDIEKGAERLMQAFPQLAMR